METSPARSLSSSTTSTDCKYGISKGSKSRRGPRSPATFALTPSTGTLSICPTFGYMRGLDPQNYSDFAIKQRVTVSTYVFSGECVNVLDRLAPAELFDNASANHDGSPRILRIDDRDSHSWISVDVLHL